VISPKQQLIEFKEGVSIARKKAIKKRANLITRFWFLPVVLHKICPAQKSSASTRVLCYSKTQKPISNPAFAEMFH